jgi:hypothetical protein
MARRSPIFWSRANGSGRGRYSAAGPDDLVGVLCPGCGSLLEPVGELAEIVGFRTIKCRDSAADDSPLGTHQRIADRVDDFFARREAILAQARLDAEHLCDPSVVERSLVTESRSSPG